MSAGFILSVAILEAVVGAALEIASTQAQANAPNSAPNPYHVVNNRAKLSEGRRWGMAIGVDVDRDGTSVWVFDTAARSCVEAGALL